MEDTAAAVGAWVEGTVGDDDMQLRAIGLAAVALLVTVLVGLASWWAFLRGRSGRPEQPHQRGRKSGKWRVTGLWVYPIKSCAGIAVDEAAFDEHGFEQDRRWMLVSAQESTSSSSSPHFFISQRVCPTLALVKPRLTTTSLLVDAPGMPTLRVELKAQAHVQRIEKMKETLGIRHPPEVKERLAREARKSQEDATVEVTIWSDKVAAIDEGDEAAEWFSRYLNKPVRLVRTPDDNRRLVSEKHRVEDAFNTVAFGDGFPFLLISEESLAALNRELPEQLPMARFRPNIVVASAQQGSEGAMPYQEDAWGLIQIGSHLMHVVKPCTRCKLTTVDPAKGSFADEEPLKTLRRVRASPDGKSAYFGQNCVHQSSSGAIHVGDPLRVLQPAKEELALRPVA